MKFIFDLFPVFVFFGVYSLAERVPETAVSLTAKVTKTITKIDKTDAVTKIDKK